MAATTPSPLLVTLITLIMVSSLQSPVAEYLCVRFTSSAKGSNRTSTQPWNHRSNLESWFILPRNRWLWLGYRRLASDNPTITFICVLHNPSMIRNTGYKTGWSPVTNIQNIYISRDVDWSYTKCNLINMKYSLSSKVVM